MISLIQIIIALWKKSNSHINKTEKYINVCRLVVRTKLQWQHDKIMKYSFVFIHAILFSLYGNRKEKAEKLKKKKTHLVTEIVEYLVQQ